jgi:hypothetical protein
MIAIHNTPEMKPAGIKTMDCGKKYSFFPFLNLLHNPFFNLDQNKYQGREQKKTQPITRRDPCCAEDTLE